MSVLGLAHVMLIATRKAARRNLRDQLDAGRLPRPFAGLQSPVGIYDTRFTPGAFHVPSPTGRIDGGAVFGQ